MAPKLFGAKAEKPHIPQSPDELHATWFTEAIGANHGGATVTDVQPERIGAGIGFVGDLYRCHLTWDDHRPELPKSVVAKVPSSVHSNRALGEGLMAYEREIKMYRDHADRLGFPMPALVHAEMDPNPAPWAAEVVRWLLDTLPLRGVRWMTDRLLSIPESAMRRFLLVMEDIDDARPAQQFEGGTLDDAYPALELLAEFHARQWMNTELVESEKLIWPLSRNPKVFQASYLRYRDDFENRFGDLVGPAMLAHLDRIQAELPERTQALVEPPWTLLHGDYRLDNILYRPDGSLVVLDYQLVLWGRGGWDVAYFITTALDPSHRDAEESLLRAYHDALVGHGVANYSWDRLITDVRTSKDLLAHRMIGTGDIIDTQVEGRDASFIDQIVQRTMGWVEVPV